MRRDVKLPIQIALGLSAALVVALVIYHVTDSPGGLVVGISDPLAAKSASECIAGAAKRDYAAFGEDLQRATGRSVELRYYAFDSQLVDAMHAGVVNAVVARAWTVLCAGHGNNIPFDRLADLPNAEGSDNLTGVFIVRTDSPAKTLKDLDGKSFLMGAYSSYEKSFAVKHAFAEANIEPSRVEIVDMCLPLAACVLDRTVDAGVISSYVVDFGGLEHLGGASQFREVARTKTIPFMTFATSATFHAEDRAAIRVAVLNMTGPRTPKGILSTGFIEPKHWQPGELAQ